MPHAVSGGRNDEFVIETGPIGLSGRAGLVLSSDVLPSRVRVSSTGSASGCSLTKPSRLVGSVLAPDGPVVVCDSARVIGSVFAGRSLVVSGSPLIKTI